MIGCQNSGENKIKNTTDSSLARQIAAYMPYIQKKAYLIKMAGLEKDDLVQEGLIGLFKAIDSYDKQLGTAFSTYAITCINNCINSAVKQAARKKHLPLNGYLSLSTQDGIELKDECSLEDIAISKEEYDALQKKINDDLSDFERDVLALYLRGYDYTALAERLDTTAKSVDNALQRARKKLKPKRRD